MLDNKFYNKIYYLGDIHGYWGGICDHVTRNEDRNVAYIQVGDFGIGFYDLQGEVDKLKLMNLILDENDCDLYIVRGNHDNPDWFKDENFADIKGELNRIRFIPDYTTIMINLEKYLFVGGAISIDRRPRMMDNKICWWVDEVFIFDKNKTEALDGIERVITHTAPAFCHPTAFGSIVYDYARNDKDLIGELRAERDRMTDMANILLKNGKNNIRTWTYGHFHSTKRMVHDNVEYTLLEINEFKRVI
jgi:hypothetical protein